ncbi:MAG: discoidin domain-containing protein [Melioribacteraceae bacterium]
MSTYCNPINISYRYCLDTPSRREAADPTVIIFQNEYYMFASKSGGYWHSIDLLAWDLIVTDDLPIEEYAPTAVVVEDWIYFMASGENSPILRTSDPKSGKWEIVNPGFPFQVIDPALLYDNGKMFLYYGCSNQNPLYGVELDFNNKLNPVGLSTPLLNGKPEIHGWEKQGDYNELNSAPWIEGAWVNKYDGKYYLQYAGPGTEFKSYGDGVYVSEFPLGPFVYQEYSPFSIKQGGFICGAGHGSTFKDISGNYRHVATQSISVKHMFERRIGLFPAEFDRQANLYSDTKWGDYPHYIKQEKSKNTFTGWMLLSYKKKASASSTLDSSSILNAFDENIRTHWSAKTGEAGEWLNVDLDGQQTINAVQINFADQDSELFGRNDGIYYQYIIEYSNDGINWNVLIDKSKNTIDSPHDYIELDKPTIARFIRITNKYVPSGKFALSGFRIFGIADKAKPKRIDDFSALRNKNDKRNVTLNWQADKNANGYIINYGISKEKLNNHFMIYEKSEITLRSLNSNCEYYFSIDSFNEGGVSLGKQIKRVN